MDKFSYALGISLGRNLKDLSIENLNIEDFAKAINDYLSNNPLAMEDAEARDIVNNTFAKMESKRNATVVEKGQKFLAENAKKENIVALPSGLQYEVINEGMGKSPKADDQVKCHYEGTLIDGTLFDSSIKRGEPAIFGVSQVIKGWVEALQLMKEGSKWRLYIPSELGYGAQGAGEMIPPHSTLIFDVELIEVL
jgi:FKBP-type peptidyl-prolyl cis-trans isomerase FklB